MWGGGGDCGCEERLRTLSHLFFLTAPSSPSPPQRAGAERGRPASPAAAGCGCGGPLDVFLNLLGCGLRAVPAFVGELESFEVLDLCQNYLQIDAATFDVLIEGCPRLREVRLLTALTSRFLGSGIDRFSQAVDPPLLFSVAPSFFPSRLRV